MIHISIPAGAATRRALPKTNNVLSNIDLIITFTICGLLYGGSSKVNDDGTPFKIVLDNINDTINVIIIPSKIIPVRIMALINDEYLLVTIKNILIIAIRIGNLPLHGTKLLVRIAISLSLGESMILHPVTPAALHPNPIHIVSACFPQALHL